MRLILVLALLLGIISDVRAESSPEIKTWQTFRSNFGYEFTYPSCWNVILDSPDENGAVTAAKNIFIAETSECKRSQLAQWTPNGISVSGGWMPIKSKQQVLSELEKKNKWIQEKIQRKEHLVFKRF